MAKKKNKRKSLAPVPPPPTMSTPAPPPDAAATDSQAQDSKKKKKKKTTAQEIQELALCLIVALILVVIIKMLVFEIFVIPSGSMEPTLHGRLDGGDRVLCTKQSYAFRKTKAPRRWEIFVFKFPYDLASEYLIPETKWKGANFIKRCVGLPGETVAISYGDVFIQPPDGGIFKRAVKSDARQRTLWIPVYNEDFSSVQVASSANKEVPTPSKLDGVDINEFTYYWRQSGQGAWHVTPAKTLLLESKTAANEVHFDYLPHIPRRDLAGIRSGIPDRYVLRQAITFACKKTLPDGTVCKGRLRITLNNQKFTARCPRCNSLMTEKNVTFYGRRSDLPRLEYSHISQGESNVPRTMEFNNVEDLRLRFRARLRNNDSVLTAELSGGDHFLQAFFAANNGKPTVTVKKMGNHPQIDFLPKTALPNVRVGSWFTVEYYYVDGVARLFVNGTEKPLLDKAVESQRLGRIANGYDNIKSGIRLAAKGSVELDDLFIDRDIYYLTGTGLEHNSSFNALGRHGQKFKVQVVVNGEPTSERAYMALGDNSPSSEDSRAWGAVPHKNLIGPAILIWWPPDRIRWLK